LYAVLHSFCPLARKVGMLKCYLHHLLFCHFLAINRYTLSLSLSLSLCVCVKLKHFQNSNGGVR
ncbi:MAG: hypothetical protein K7J15_03145, partial [Candidatus Regiella insecticola]|nr:hypothetical protein [Candidatus Regiella insecticola]